VPLVAQPGEGLVDKAGKRISRRRHHQMGKRAVALQI
jgi:hypothetical protein